MKTSVDRRVFLKAAGGITISGFGIGILGSACTTKDDFPTDADGNETPADGKTYAIDLKEAANEVLGNTGGALKFSVEGYRLPVIVIRISDGEVIALESWCPHAGCEVDLPQNGSIVCNCHQSVFDLSGEVTQGPATTALTEIPSRLDDETIILTVG